MPTRTCWRRACAVRSREAGSTQAASRWSGTCDREHASPSGAMFSVRVMPWHRLRAVLDRLLAASARRRGGLGWRVAKEPRSVELRPGAPSRCPSSRCTCPTGSLRETLALTQLSYHMNLEVYR
jgi:hypothetical protein